MEFVSNKKVKNEFEDYLRTFSPNKGKNMNVTPTTNTVEQNDSLDGRRYYIDAEGNRVEIPFDTDFDSADVRDGETTRTVTAFIAEDAADHPVTVH